MPIILANRTIPIEMLSEQSNSLFSHFDICITYCTPHAYGWIWPIQYMEQRDLFLGPQKRKRSIFERRQPCVLVIFHFKRAYSWMMYACRYDALSFTNHSCLPAYSRIALNGRWKKKAGQKWVEKKMTISKNIVSKVVSVECSCFLEKCYSFFARVTQPTMWYSIIRVALSLHDVQWSTVFFYSLPIFDPLFADFFFFFLSDSSVCVPKITNNPQNEKQQSRKDWQKTAVDRRRCRWFRIELKSN